MGNFNNFLKGAKKTGGVEVDQEAMNKKRQDRMLAILTAMNEVFDKFKVTPYEALDAVANINQSCLFQIIELNKKNAAKADLYDTLMIKDKRNKELEFKEQKPE